MADRVRLVLIGLLVLLGVGLTVWLVLHLGFPAVYGLPRLRRVEE